jgi:hypothetical protein
MLAQQLSTEIEGLLSELNAPFSQKLVAVQSMNDIFLSCETLK